MRLPPLRPPLLYLQPRSRLIWAPARIATTSARSPALPDLPRVAPGSRDHDSLDSFIAHAARVALPPNTSYYVGTHYEYTAAASFAAFGMRLTRVGKKNDAGIDLIGHWVLGPLRPPMPVIMQCKARTASLGPCHVREIEGSFLQVPAAWTQEDVLGVLVTTRKATKGTLDAMARSQRALAFAMVDKDGTVRQFCWNRAAADRGLAGLGVSIVYGRDTKAGKSVQLTFMGSPIRPAALPTDPHPTSTLTETLIAEPIPGQDGVPVTAHAPPQPRGGLWDPSPSLLDGERHENRGRPPGARNKHPSCRMRAPRRPQYPAPRSTFVEKQAEDPDEVSKIAVPSPYEAVKRKAGRPVGSRDSYARVRQRKVLVVGSKGEEGVGEDEGVTGG